MRDPLAEGVARAQRVLANTPLPWDSALQHLADSVVPAVADAFVLAVEDGTGHLQTAAAAASDPVRSAALAELDRRYRLPIDSPFSLAEVHRTGVSRIVRGDEVGTFGDPDMQPEIRELVRQVVIPVSVLVPLRVRGRPLGALALGFDDDGAIDASGLSLIEDLAYACAVAVDNAQLYRAAQEALHQSHGVLAQLDTVLTGAPIGIGILDRDLRFVRCNPALAEIHGTTVEDSVGRTLQDLMPDIARRMTGVMQQVLDDARSFKRLQVTTRTPGAPDVDRHFEASLIPVFDAAGETTAIAAIVVEITMQRRARDVLDERVRQQEALAELSRVALAQPALDVLFDHLTGVVADVLGAPLAAVLELMPAGERLVLRASRGWRQNGTRMPAGEDSHFGVVLSEARTVVFSGVDAHPPLSPSLAGMSAVSGVLVPIRGRMHPFGVLAVHDGRRRSFTRDEIAFLEAAAAVLQGAIARDETEHQLARSQKLEAVGRLAGGLAHDFNNLLTVVTVNAELIAGEPDHPRVGQAIGDIRDATDRAAQLARQILTFSRGARPPAETTDLSSTLRELRDLLVPLLRSDVVLDLEVDEADALAVRMGPGQLEQVVVNLAINARDAMPEGGRLTIAADLVDAPATADLPPGDAAAPYVRLRVVDDGHGMDADTRTRALDPFFTTKGEEQGTGLGLSTSWAIVRAAGGDVAIDSEPGSGTTVTVFLPAAWSVGGNGDPAPDGPLAATQHEPQRRRVLVVEDQPSIRALVCQTLQAHGYDATGVPDGPSACEVDEEPDLLLTDIVMPGMSGDEVVRRLRGRWPDLRALYMSGFAGGPPEAPDLPPGHFLAKPFGLRELLDAVADALED